MSLAARSAKASVGSPFGPPCACPPKPPTARHHHASGASTLQRKSSMDVGMQRQLSGTASTLGRRSSSRVPALGAVAELSGNGFLDILTDPRAATTSFDDVCEVLGDVAKLDTVGTTLSASLGAGQALKGLLGNNAAVGWLVEKATSNLHQFTLLEGFLDKTLLDLFQQLYSVLDLDGTIFDLPAVRLMVAAAVALVVRQLVQQYKQQHPAKLERQMSPAASLSDALAESAAAAIIASSVSGSSTDAEQLQPSLACASAASSSSTNYSAFAAANSTSSISAGSSLSSFKAVTSSLLKQQELSPLDKVDVAARSLVTCMVLGQFKRANKLKRKARKTFAEASEGRWSPGLLLVLLEGACVMHNYSEMASGLTTLLHIGG